MNTTWQDLEEMKRGMALMLQGNPYFAWQLPNGGYHPCQDLAQLDRHAQEIFNGKKTAGFYSIRPDSLTRFAAFDFDAHGNVGVTHWRDSARRVFDEVASKFPEAWFIESSPGGFHVIGFAPELLPARDIRSLLRPFAPADVEVFPKQDTLRDDPKAKGSLLRFPGKHQLKCTWAHFIERSGRIADVSLQAAPKRKVWVEPSLEGRLASLYQIATRGILLTRTGQRFEAMKRIAGRLKGRASEEKARKVYEIWHNRNTANIKTPFQESLIQFLSWFREAAPCNMEIPEYPTTPEEEALIERLVSAPGAPVEALRQVARFLLQAKKHAENKGMPEFFLSLRMIADRLGVSIATACRYRSECVRQGFVQLVERGHTGLASTFRPKP